MITGSIKQQVDPVAQPRLESTPSSIPFLTARFAVSYRSDRHARSGDT